VHQCRSENDKNIGDLRSAATIDQAISNLVGPNFWALKSESSKQGPNSTNFSHLNVIQKVSGPGNSEAQVEPHQVHGSKRPIWARSVVLISQLKNTVC
jgi:hypothetical protein